MTSKTELEMWFSALTTELKKLPPEALDEYRELFGDTVRELVVVLSMQHPVPENLYVTPVLEEHHMDNQSEYTVKAGMTAVVWLINRPEMATLRKLLTLKEPPKEKKNRSRYLSRAEKLHKAAAGSPVGSVITCPACGETIIKKTYQHKFCCTKCKERYWNNIGS